MKVTHLWWNSADRQSSLCGGTHYDVPDDRARIEAEFLKELLDQGYDAHDIIEAGSLEWSDQHGCAWCAFQRGSGCDDRESHEAERRQADIAEG